MKFHFYLIFIIVMFTFLEGANPTTDSLWSEIATAKKDKLPRTAIQLLDTVISQSYQAKRHDEWVKAICERIILQAKEEGPEDENKIRLLEKELPGADPQARPLLQIVLARWYWRYYDYKKWPSQSLTEADSTDDNDFTTWPVRKLFSKIDSLYHDVLKAKTSLMQIPISDFRNFLEPGTLPEKLRPTLYDFALWEALLFYIYVKQAGIKSEDAFEISGASDAFGPLSSFLNYAPNTTDKESPKYKSLMLFKVVLRHYLDTKNVAALIDADLHRLTYVRTNVVGNGLDEIFIKRLNEIVKTYSQGSQGELASFVKFRLAEVWFDKKEYEKAYTLANCEFANAKDTLVRDACKVLMSRITCKELELTSKDIVPPLPWKMKVEYKNFTRIYFRAVKDEWKRLLKDNRYNDRREQYAHDSMAVAELIRKKPDFEWQQELSPTKDYKTHSIVLSMPQLRPGFYRIFASWEPDFKTSTMMQQASMWVSSIAPAACKSNNGNFSGLVVDAQSGEPVQNAEVTIYVKEDTLFNPTKQFLTDTSGHFKTEGPSTYFLVHFKKGEDEFLDTVERHGSYSNKNSYKSIVLFADRSIYRPGQIINFKGIFTDVNQAQDDCSVLPEKEVDVSLCDRGFKVLSTQRLKTNEFGSFSGTFSAPAQKTFASQWLISGKEHRDDNDNNSKYGNYRNSTVEFRVEEYKRPTFTVNLHKPTVAFRVNDTVIVKGDALAYTGNLINGATVKFSITRDARKLPWWCCNESNNVERSKSLIHGETVTGDDGKFRIPFFASADSSISLLDNAIYEYKINADVTTADGETRTNTMTVSVGYKTLDLAMNVDQNPRENRPFQIKIRAATMDGVTIPSSGILKVYRLREPTEPVPSNLEQTNKMYGRESFEMFDTSEVYARPWPQWPREKMIAEKQFNTSKNGFTEFSLQCGVYLIEASSKDRFNSEVKSYLPIIVIPGEKCSVFPVKVPSMAEQSATVAEVGDTVHFLWGTGYSRGMAFVEIEEKDTVVNGYWTDLDSTMHSFSVPIEEKHRGGFTANITFVHDNQTYSHQLKVDVPFSNKVIICSLSTFRSTIVPGEKEKWTVTLKGKTQQLKDAEVVVSMYDFSLDQIYPHCWGRFGSYYRNWSNRFLDRINFFRSFNILIDNWNQWYSYPKMTYYSIPRSIDWHRNLRSIAGIGYGSGFGGSGSGGVDGLIGNLMGGDGGGLDLKKRENFDITNNDKLDFGNISIRKNLEETAFFYPQLKMDQNGTVTFDFTAPEALTTWKLLLLAHGKKCENGGLSALVMTRKKLMIQPNAPRFLREGDTLFFTARVTNLSDTICNARANLELKDFSTGKLLDTLFNLKKVTQNVIIPSGQSRSVAWELVVPRDIGPVTYTVRAIAQDYSDGETGVLPVLSSRILVTESVPLTLQGPQKKEYNFEKLYQVGSSQTLEPKILTVQMTSNPTWYVLQSLPYLISYSYECSEQLFNRYYGNILSSHILNLNPKIKEIYKGWAGTDALKSNLEKNDKLKSLVLEETPWLIDAAKEAHDKRQVANLLSDSTIALNLESAYEKLKDRQLPNGAWPWFENKPDPFITIYIVSGFGRLKNMGVEINPGVALQAVTFLDGWIENLYTKRNKEETNQYKMISFYLYARSMFLKDKPIPPESKPALDYYLNKLESGWTDLNSLMSEGHAALAFNRFGMRTVALLIMKSLKERNFYNKESGRYLPEIEQTWRWDHAPVETQALMIEAFDEITSDTAVVEECKMWLVNQKRLASWSSTKATADAVYALMMTGDNLLSDERLVKVSLGNVDCTPAEAETGTGFYEKVFVGKEIKPDFGTISVTKESKGVAWGGVHLQYLEDISKISTYKTNLAIDKQLFLNRNTKNGPVITPIKSAIRVGDLVTVRLIIKVDNDMEYVHLKDMRGSGLEPVDVLSGYKYGDGLEYYQSTKDVATNFFIDQLPKGTHVLEYKLRVFHAGKYQSGIAQIQCMYAPEFNSHSGSVLLNVGE